MYVYFFFFFFQAEDGIRDWSVTGVQTCALPILAVVSSPSGELTTAKRLTTYPDPSAACLEVLDELAERAGVPWAELVQARSEERRVGKECRSRWGPEQ